MNTKTMITIILLIFSFTNSIAQNKIVDKTYVAQVGASCKKMDNGGCMIYSYCSFKFEKDSVLVSNFTKASCSPIEKESFYNTILPERIKYSYSIKNNVITIKNFTEYGKLKYYLGNIIGRKEMNYKEYEKLIFELQK